MKLIFFVVILILDISVWQIKKNFLSLVQCYDVRTGHCVEMIVAVGMNRAQFCSIIKFDIAPKIVAVIACELNWERIKSLDWRNKISAVRIVAVVRRTPLVQIEFYNAFIITSSNLSSNPKVEINRGLKIMLNLFSSENSHLKGKKTLKVHKNMQPFINSHSIL